MFDVETEIVAEKKDNATNSTSRIVMVKILERKNYLSEIFCDLYSKHWV